MVEIVELPESIKDISNTNIREVPQLKYVVEMSEKICPYVGFVEYPHWLDQGGTHIFLERYFDGKIVKSFMPTYQNNTDLQKTLEAYGIDPTAFWYLILFLKDYVDDESAGKKSVISAYTEIYNLAACLYKMDFRESPFDGAYGGCQNEGLLKFKV